MAMIGVSAVVFVSLFLFGYGDDFVIDNNQFLLYNKVYHKARLRQWGKGWRDYGTWEHEIGDNQLWEFEPHPTQSGCYYIINEANNRYRLADHKQHGLILVKGTYKNNHLFKLIPSGNNDNYFYINSCLYTKQRITKYGAANDKVGLYKGDKFNDNQLWKLVPRFQADIYTDAIFHFDNRQGSTAITREISVTTGVVTTQQTSVRSTTTFKTSMEASVAGMKASAEFTQQLETSLSSSTTESWSKTEKISFTIPPGKNFKVMQHKVDFTGVVPQDSCTLLTSIKIFESDTATFADPDNFII